MTRMLTSTRFRELYTHARDLLCAVGVAEGAEGLLEVDVSGREGADHDGLCVAAQRILEDARQLRLAVRNQHVLLRVVALLRQCRDDVAEHRERQVDGGALLESIARRAGRLCSL